MIYNVLIYKSPDSDSVCRWVWAVFVPPREGNLKARYPWSGSAQWGFTSTRRGARYEARKYVRSLSAPKITERFTVDTCHE